MAIPIAVAQAAPGAVQAGRDIMGYSAAVDQYKGREAAFQRQYASQKSLYDQYSRNVKSYEKSRAAYEKLSQQYDQRVQAYQANPTKTGLAGIRMLEANLRMLGTPLQAEYQRLQAEERTLTPYTLRETVKGNPATTTLQQSSSKIIQGPGGGSGGRGGVQQTVPQEASINSSRLESDLPLRG